MKHKYPILRKSFSLAMALLLALSMPMQVFAEVIADLSNGDVNIGADNVGHYVAPDTPVVEAHGGSVTVVQSGGETNHTVTVDTTSNPVASSSGGTGNATLNANDNFYTEAAGGDNHVDVVLGQNDGSTDNGVDIDAGNTPAIDVKTDSGDTVDIQIGSATTNELHSDEPAISITGGGDVTISGDSSGSLYSEGITVEDGSSLTIKSGLVDVNGNVAVENNADLTVKDGSLDVSGRIGAGGGDVTINGGDVTADGGSVVLAVKPTVKLSSPVVMLWQRAKTTTQPLAPVPMRIVPQLPSQVVPSLQPTLVPVPVSAAAKTVTAMTLRFPAVQLKQRAPMVPVSVVAAVRSVKALRSWMVTLPRLPLQVTLISTQVALESAVVLMQTAAYTSKAAS